MNRKKERMIKTNLVKTIWMSSLTLGFRSKLFTFHSMILCNLIFAKKQKNKEKRKKERKKDRKKARKKERKKEGKKEWKEERKKARKEGVGKNKIMEGRDS